MKNAEPFGKNVPIKGKYLDYTKKYTVYSWKNFPIPATQCPPQKNKNKCTRTVDVRTNKRRDDNIFWAIFLSRTNTIRIVCDASTKELYFKSCDTTLLHDR